MYIGNISKGITPKFYHANTNIPFQPEITDKGFTWKMLVIYDRAVDIKYSLDCSFYIGEIVHGISGAQEINVFVDGVRVAVKDLKSPAHVNLYGSEVIIRARGNISDLNFSGAEIYGFCPEDNEPLLLPRPKTYKTDAKNVKIGKIIGGDKDESFAKSFLEESLVERLEAMPDGDGITLKFEICKDYEQERYTVDITDAHATVRAATRLALLWGACRVIDLWDGAYLPITHIDDKPDVPMRGFHMGLPARENFDFFKRIFRYVLLPYGYNHVILEFNGDMRYDRHPEISEKWLE